VAPVHLAAWLFLGGLLALLAALGLRSAVQALAAILILCLTAVWISRTVGIYVGAAIIAARIGTVLISTLIVEHYISATGADVEMYRALGKEIADSLWRFGIWPASGETWGTAAYINFSGLCYFLFGSNPLVIAFISSGAGAIGSILFYKGFVQYYGRPSRSLLVLFFWPSVVYWSSIEGKDPWSFLLVGLGFWGISTVFTANSRRAVGACLASSIGLFFLRPHIAVLYLGAIAFCLLFHTRPKTTRQGISRAFSVVILLIALACGIFVQKIWTGSEVEAGEIPYQVSERLEGLNTGGSAIEVPEFSSWTAMAAYIPAGAATVMFRPFPWEEGDSFLKISSIDQLGLTVIICLIVANLVSALRKKRISAILRDKLLLFLLGYCMGFVVLMLFVSGNLGTLVREKIQLFPFALCAAASLRLHSRHPDISAQRG
jgi:hypothetical protein